MKLLKPIFILLLVTGFVRADGLRIAVKSIELKSRPDGSSWSTATVKLNDEVVVQEEVEVVPDWKGFDPNVPATGALPRWVKVAVGDEVGYIPEGTLAQGGEIEVAISDGGVFSAQANKVTKGFSEVEDDVALSTMKGAAGKSDLGSVAAVEKLRGVCIAGAPDVIAVRRFVTDGELEKLPFPARSVGDEKARTTKLTKKRGIDPVLIAKYKKLKEITKDSKDRDIKMAMDAMQAMIAKSFEDIDPIREHAIGEYVAARFIMKHKVVSDADPRSSYVQKLGQVLITAANGPACYAPCQFILLDTPSVTNACAISGGYVFVMSGLLDFVRDEDELACILAHELAHVELHHGMRAVGAGALFQLFSSAADYALADEKSDDKEFSKALDWVFTVMTSVAEDGYGAKLEAEADWRGMQIAAHLGYDVTAMVEVFKRLKDATGGTGGSGYPKNRIEDAVSYCTGFGFDRIKSSGRETRCQRFARYVLH